MLCLNMTETAQPPRAAQTVLLQMRHIGKSFSGTRVLDDVYFELLAGEVHVLAGAVSPTGM